MSLNDYTYKDIQDLMPHFEALNMKWHYLRGERSDLPWHLVTRVESVSHGYAELKFIAEEGGHEYQWSFRVWEREGGHGGPVTYYLDDIKDVYGRLSGVGRVAFREALNQYADSLEKGADSALDAYLNAGRQRNDFRNVLDNLGG